MVDREDATHVHITIAVPMDTWEAFDDWLTDEDTDSPEGIGAVIVDYQYGHGA